MISKYNIHNNELRCISEETAQLDMSLFIAYNGHEIRESDKLLCEALSEHFKSKGWHCVTNNALHADEGKTTGRILKKKSRAILKIKITERYTDGPFREVFKNGKYFYVLSKGGSISFCSVFFTVDLFKWLVTNEFLVSLKVNRLHVFVT